MRLLDLFAGIGGFSLAAHWMGWTTEAFVERDKFCQKVLRKNFGHDIEIHDDILNFSGKPFRDRVDIITGGFPCQPFSQAGKRKGRDDERHLFPAMLRVISEVKPSWVVAENVRGLLSIESGKVFTEVISSLEGIGYEVVTFCVPASAVEAPHRRDRLWVVAHSQSVTNSRRPGAIRSADGRQNGRVFSEPSNTDRVSFADATNSTGLGSGTRWAECSGQQRRATPIGANRSASNTENNTENDELLTTNSKRVHAQGCGDRSGQIEFRRGGWDEQWIQAATRLCRMDDVVPNRVDRLKSLGNSIVPQIAYEIFKAIEATEKEGMTDVHDGKTSDSNFRI